MAQDREAQEHDRKALEEKKGDTIFRQVTSKDGEPVEYNCPVPDGSMCDIDERKGVCMRCDKRTRPHEITTRAEFLYTMQQGGFVWPVGRLSLEEHYAVGLLKQSRSMF